MFYKRTIKSSFYFIERSDDVAKLDSLINKIRTAIYGKDVRSAIADSIEAMNIENQETSDKVHCLGNIFNNLI